MMELFFKPKSIAVIGASGTPGKLGYVIIKNISDSDFSGNVYPVNPKSDEILGYKVYRSVTEIPGDVDLVVTVLPTPKLTVATMEDCAKKGVKAVIIESAGFAEMGGDGKLYQQQIVDIAKKNNIRVMGPNCSGIVSRDIVTSIYPITKKVPKGNVVLIGQSGLLAAGMASDLVENESLNVRNVCSFGNKCDVNENDLLEYFGNQDDVDVISMYLETISDGRNLTRIAKKVAAEKPVIFLSGGRTEAGARAAMSHTGSIASNAMIVEAAVKQTGMIMADDFTELKDFARVFSTQPLPKGNRVAVITLAGSVGVNVSDLCANFGLELPKLTPETTEKLKDMFDTPVSNPVDLYFSVTKIGFTKTLETTFPDAFRDPNIDAAVIILAGFKYTEEAVQKKIIQKIVKEVGKPVVVCMVVGYNKYKNVIMDEMGKELPVFPSLISGVKALSKLCEYGIRKQKMSS
ncbi:AcdA-1 acetate--coA ligase (ADP-forming), alpha chain [Desulfamplus magnetovallimortis]|uniref:AcdA-1 acetate--coA ligase (ADP-forming), alpha chain n=1 Tax=Desulfamplus magnetovallimortis TaxID=1246637 RepID=A0A1W1HH14_9BACT|nr:CoA-binding protein [Desulfamplus magnetovallimortis]SLM31705.1 AcdA-1 acetate--coA ligase (ADP-forming), alpha chain [Desulfamplus magnetovallimortis]